MPTVPPDRRRSGGTGSRLRAACSTPAAGEHAAGADGLSAHSSAASTLCHWRQPVKALGTIIEKVAGEPGPSEVYSGILDYYDHWESVDSRLGQHHERLSRVSEVFAHDLVNMATYVHEIIRWLQPDRICQSQSVVSVAAMTEGFLVSARSACDAVADGIAYVACPHRIQAPSDSLRRLLNWAKKHTDLLRPSVASLLGGDFNWFWTLRSLRDHIVHSGAHANIHCDTRQFNLWVFSPRVGWVTREPLLPLLKGHFVKLLAFSNSASSVINDAISMPADRLGCRVVHGVYIPSLHKLVEFAEEYAAPSP